MYLHDSELRHLVHTIGLIENFNEKNLGCIAYDLTISKICVDARKRSSYTLKPGEVAFVEPVENVRLPNDCLGIVIERNSGIRSGLSITAPVYQPGHHTKVFFRVQNISNNGIYLEMGMSISSIMFYQLSGDVEHPYQGGYAEEFNFSGIGEFHSVAIPEIEELFEEKMESIHDLEKGIYNNVLVLITIFIAIFSLINFNINALKNISGIADIIIYNLMSVSVVAVLTSLVTMIISKTKEKTSLGKKMLVGALIGLTTSIVIFMVVY